MVLGHLLFRVPRLELAELVSSCSASNWEVSRYHGVRFTDTTYKYAH